MHRLNRRQFVTLVLLTLVWSVNWPVMKMGVTGYPALTFRTLSIWLGLPVLALALVLLKVPFRLPRRHWRELAWLTLTNMLVWNVCIILAVRTLSSGRAAILGYTMPIFSALIGAALFSTRLPLRAWGGVAAAGVGVVLLLQDELSQLAGRPLGLALALTAAASWALGTQLLRRTKIDVPTLTLSFWMTALTALGLTALSVLFERDGWRMPDTATGWAIVYNAVMIFGFAQPAWFFLARGLPPIASTLSVMLIPVLGVLSGAIWLGETVHWQDGVAVALIMVAIASVLWPARR
jgi:drug/metabolite transporter (DMT)-like permease